MRIDLVLPNEGPHALQCMKAAPLFEDMGYGGLWLTDHVVGIAEYSFYQGYWLEMLTSMAYLARATKKVRLGAGVLVAPMRDPLITAKMLSTIDVLSDGRLDLGVGTGWAPREFEATGRMSVFEDRGRFIDEAIETFLECWKGGELTYDRKFSKANQVVFEPVPVQKPHPPIWIGARGLAEAPGRRTARYADVWHPTSLTPEQIVRGGDEIDAMAGRKIPRSIRYHTTELDVARSRLEGYRAVGVFQATIDFKVRTFSEFLKLAEDFAKAEIG
jgi:probable F420-dependent oxidoreductase